MLPCDVWCFAINGRGGDTMIAEGLYRYIIIVVKNSIRQKGLEVQLQEAPHSQECWWGAGRRWQFTAAEPV
jgi:hypothetical protein